MKRGQTAPKGRHTSKTLAVRMLVARVAWLDWPMRWVDGSCCLSDGSQTITPTVADFAATTRCLNKIPSYPIAARAVLGDLDAWLGAKRRRLDFIRSLKDVSAPVPRPHPDLSTTMAICGALVVEALAVNDVVPAPSTELLRIGLPARVALVDLIAGPDLPVAAKVLAALVIGAIDRETTNQSRPPHVSFDHRTSGAYQYGAEFGLPANTRIFLNILSSDGGFERAVRLAEALPNQRTFALTDDQVTELFRNAATVDDAIDTIVALTESEAIATRLRKVDLAHFIKVGRSGWCSLSYVEQAGRIAEAQIASIREHLHYCAVATGMPGTVRHLTSILRRLLIRAETAPDRATAINGSISKVGSMVRMAQENIPEQFETLSAMVAERIKYEPDLIDTPKLSLLAFILVQSKSVETSDWFWRSKLAKTVSRCGWNDPSTFTLVVNLALGLMAPEAEATADANQFLSFVFAEPDSKMVKRSIVRFYNKLRLLERETRTSVLSALRSERRYDDVSFEQYLSIVTPVLDICGRVSCENERAGTALVRIACEFGKSDLHSVVSEISWAQNALRDASQPAIDVGLRIALLGTVDSRSFRDIIRASAGRTFELNAYELDGALDLISRNRQLTLVVKSEFVRQPQRCVSLIAEMARLARCSNQDMSIYSCLHIRTTAAPGETDIAASDAEPAAVTDPPDQGACLITIGDYISARNGSQVDGTRSQIPTPAVKSQAAPNTSNDIETVYVDTGLIALTADPRWYRLASIFPATAPLVAQYLQNAVISRQDLRLPKSLAKIIEVRQRAQREIDFLTAALEIEPDRPDLHNRIQKCRLAIESFESNRAVHALDACEILNGLLEGSVFAVLEAIVDGAYRRRLRELAGPALYDRLPAELSSDLRNAIGLATTADYNRKLFAQIIREHLEGDAGWRSRHPLNVEFLAELANRGADIDLWQSAFPRRYPSADVDGGWVHLHVETDPLRILQMGNYFGTCLSLGSFNAFSTAANACELNKRVVFACDARGRTVARKLIGLSTGYQLIGFHTYTNDSTGHSAEALSRTVERYARTFADACRIPLVDAGDVPSLFAENWYDDGPTAWTTVDEEAPAKSSTVIKTSVTDSNVKSPSRISVTSP